MVRGPLQREEAGGLPGFARAAADIRSLRAAGRAAGGRNGVGRRGYV